ncbi:hypothetical protein HanRHA438_Chr07g0320861 [Helianthus annuus]|nr:hypothetical protein HanHA89_Chr07g0273841 [Helianthus annuus]KAJ0729723.1 hypothetical protein HanLR1_Chr07g0256131 [Helianthus annuus]KAJ0909370.1 hypothetical protein HanRHA438_Chr07g0320861 [Helianthus annuus]
MSWITLPGRNVELVDDTLRQPPFTFIESYPRPLSCLTRPLHASPCNTNISFPPCSRQRATRTPNRCCDINHDPHTPQATVQSDNTTHYLPSGPYTIFYYKQLGSTNDCSIWIKQSFQSKIDLINPKSVLAVWGTFGAIITHGSSSYLINQLQFTQIYIHTYIHTYIYLYLYLSTSLQLVKKKNLRDVKLRNRKP